MSTSQGKGADVLGCDLGLWRMVYRPADAAEDDDAQEDDTEYDSNPAQAEEHTACAAGVAGSFQKAALNASRFKVRDFAWRIILDFILSVISNHLTFAASNNRVVDIGERREKITGTKVRK